MMGNIPDPKYHIGDEVMYNFIDSSGGGIDVVVITRIQYMDERTGRNMWLYNNGECGFFENQIIKKLN